MQRNERAGSETQGAKSSTGQVKLDGIDHLDDQETQGPLDDHEALALAKKGKGNSSEQWKLQTN